jgi:hypothetical protein
VRDGEDDHVFARALRLKDQDDTKESDVMRLIDEWVALPDGDLGSREAILKISAGHMLRAIAESKQMDASLPELTQLTNRGRE